MILLLNMATLTLETLDNKIKSVGKHQRECHDICLDKIEELERKTNEKFEALETTSVNSNNFDNFNFDDIVIKNNDDVITLFKNYNDYNASVNNKLLEKINKLEEDVSVYEWISKLNLANVMMLSFSVMMLGTVIRKNLH